MLVPSTIASIPPVDSAYLARLGPSRFPDDGSATSAIRLFVGGRISVYTRLVDQQPGSQWSVEIFDAGTCANVHAFVARLDDIRIGSNGVGSRTDSITSHQSALLRGALASRRRLVVRLTGSGWQTCQTYGAVNPASLGSSAPPTTGTPTTPDPTSDATPLPSSDATPIPTPDATPIPTPDATPIPTPDATPIPTPSPTTPACIPTPEEDCVPDGPPDEE